MFTGVVVTGDKVIACVVVTGDKIIAGVVVTGDKLINLSNRSGIQLARGERMNPVTNRRGIQ